jgi:hypothetical protein
VFCFELVGHLILLLLIFGFAFLFLFFVYFLLLCDYSFFLRIIDWKIQNLGNGGTIIDEPNASNIINRIGFRV